jgi:hypothetical protein
VSLGVAKDQRLSLNPTQISGACGRLMCSLRYEHEFYVQARRRFPKEGKAVRTSVGEERVISNDIFRERVVLRSSEGEMRTIPLAQLLKETEAAGGTFTPAMSERRAQAISPTAVDRVPSEADEEIDETLEEDEDVVDAAEEEAPATAAKTTPSEGTPAPGSGERRPHRRRGRRGGRRNRGRRGGGKEGPPA